MKKCKSSRNFGLPYITRFARDLRKLCIPTFKHPTFCVANKLLFRHLCQQGLHKKINEEKHPIRKRICVMSQVPVFVLSFHQSKYAKSVHWAYMYFFHYKFYHDVGQKCVIFYPGLLVFIIDLFVLLTSNFAFRASSVNVVCTMCSIMLILQSNTMKERTKIGMELA